jgi:hypothetical protein
MKQKKFLVCGDNEKMTPEKWNDEDWDDFEEYLKNLSAKDLKNELKFLESLGKAKKSGKNIVMNESFYIM